MPAYQAFTAARATEPDPPSLLTALRALDATAGVQHTAGPSYILKKATVWTAPQITAAQTVIETAPASSPQLTAQAFVDQMSVYDKARDLATIDALNVIRNLLPVPLGPISILQALAAIRAKAGTL
jgi:hypothetical protein